MHGSVCMFWLLSWDRQTHAFSDIYPNISAEVYDADNCILFERQFISYIEKLISIWLLLMPCFSFHFVICIVVVVVGHILFARICLQRANNPSHIGTLAYTLKFSHVICEGMEITKSKTNAKTQHFLHNNLTGCRLIIFFAAAQFFFYFLLFSYQFIWLNYAQNRVIPWKKQSSADLIFKKNCEYLKQNSQHTQTHTHIRKEEKSGTATKKKFRMEICALFFFRCALLLDSSFINMIPNIGCAIASQLWTNRICWYINRMYFTSMFADILRNSRWIEK